MPSYHFSLGNSTDGPIGFCARVEASDASDAVDRLQEILSKRLNGNEELEIYSNGPEYVSVYFNQAVLSFDDIDEEDEDEGEDDE